MNNPEAFNPVFPTDSSATDSARVDLPPDPPPSEAVPSESGRRPHPLAAWIVILLSVGFIAGVQALGGSSPRAGVAHSMVTELQLRYLIGAAELTGQKEEMHRSMRPQLQSSSTTDALVATIASAELVGPEQALEELDAVVVRAEIKAEPLPGESVELVELVEALHDLYTSRLRDDFAETGPLPRTTAYLKGHLGWMGELALHPVNGADPAARQQILNAARKTAMVLFAIMGIACFGLLAGAALLTTWLVFAFTGRLEWRLQFAQPTGGYYAETFAIWLVSFFGMNLVLGRLVSADLSLIAAGTASALSLACLAWPVWRGIPWSQVCQELGLAIPRRVWIEPFVGGLAYVAGAPLLALGIFLTVVLMWFQQALVAVNLFAAQPPVHPIIEPLARGTAAQRFVAILVVLLVPITEEIMFRGVLYRHLRSASHRLGRFLSIAGSTLASAFLFAAIHPQGWLGVPPLMAVAIILALLREWRGSLVAPTVTHMIVNGVTTLVVLLAFS